MFWKCDYPPELVFDNYFDALLSGVTGTNKSLLERHRRRLKQEFEWYVKNLETASPTDVRRYLTEPVSKKKSRSENEDAAEVPRLSPGLVKSFEYIYDSIRRKGWFKTPEEFEGCSDFHRIADMVYRSSENLRCAYCGINPISEIDHFLPKSQFPLLSICIWNLVPCCSFCNKNKADYWTTEDKENLLQHPRFSSQEKWLHAKTEKVAEKTESGQYVGTRVDFCFDRNAAGDQIAQIKHSEEAFEALGLKNTYRHTFASVIADQAFLLQEVYASGGMDSVSEDLLSKAQILLKRDPNNPLGLLYEALSKDKMFCDGGFSKAGQKIQKVSSHNGEIITSLSKRKLPSFGEIHQSVYLNTH